MKPPSGVAEELIRGPEPADPELGNPYAHAEPHWEWGAKGDGANNFIQPLFDPADFRFDRFLKSDPPKRKWVIEGVLPLGVAGLLASMGGAGKSFFMYQLGLCITTGRPFLGMEMGEPGGFLYLAAEDDEAELHRRGLTLIEHYQRMAGPFDRKAVAEQLYVVPRVASDNLLTHAGGAGEVHLTALVERIVKSAIQISDLRMIVLDPVSRFRGGGANNEEDNTRFVEALEVIREATGATVLGLAHLSQAGIKDGGGQEIVRGSTALVDGVRWVATLQRLRRDQAANYGVMKEEADRYLRLEIPKSNYTAPFAGLWLKREAGGVMVPTELEERAGTRAQKRTEAQYLDILARIQELLQEEGPLTATRIEKEYAGELGVLGAGQKKVRDVLTRAVKNGDLTRQPNRGKGGGQLLHLPEEGNS